MKITKTFIQGLLIIEPLIFEDERGYFFESYNKIKYFQSGLDTEFIQDNESKSTKGVIRGLHYQLAPFAQSKLVRVVQGRIFDVAVDLRKGSPSYGKWFGLELNDTDKKQFFIPRGFAHGFSVLSETAILSYKCDNVYKKEYERSVNFNDQYLKIEWEIDPSNIIVSEKDKQAPFFENAEMNFIF
ncbi:MAG: dTDP-4-dehydrorhamnose 3,5-epimerase [Bacteroidales bacterium]|jgi:dTDP-4-dehydrorhamnose 3,5-epimerase|nr:dTDP-4-dehydrorhamnose 3,5-epimerase [Bacteroidales bacterium]